MTSETMQVVYQRPEALTPVVTHYCPGCTHGIIHRLVGEVMDELGIRESTIGVASVGCSVFSYNYFDCDFAEAPHGRAPAMATGIKRVHPDQFVFTYQGDGDLASIGTAEIVHAATRGENITVIFVNNGVYGMTGGQMAPTTLPGMRTTSSPAGRDVETMGYPVRMSEVLAQLDGTSYIVRRTVHEPGQIHRAKRAIKTAFQVQMHQMGFSMVEILSTCPINWNMTPTEALHHVAERMIPYFPLGDYKVAPGVKELEDERPRPNGGPQSTIIGKPRSPVFGKATAGVIGR